MELAAGHDHLQPVAKALAKFGASARQSIDSASSAGDADTQDLFTKVPRGVDQLLWMAEAPLQANE